MKHLIIGTAGHVDHGKTALIRALTGQDTDRLPEEKARGISIDLGFAQFRLPSGRRASIIDVPGHERFIRNMLAGITGIDLVLLVVAADEGVMPQTREHLDILQLLGIKQGVVVLTKVDLVDAELLDLVREDVAAAVKGTFLEGAPVVPVSSVTGEGLDRLVQIVDGLLEVTEPKDVTSFARMPVDQAFVRPGFGTVVRGTLVSGRIRTGDRLELLPQGLEVRVRGLQVHGEKVEVAEAGQRVGVNLSGVERAEVRRGDVLAEPGVLRPTDTFAGRLHLLASVPRPLRHGARVHLHTGASEVTGRVLLLDRDELEPGDSAFIQFRSEAPLVVGRGDRFIIRSYSPVHTIGGGGVIEPHARYRRHHAPHLEELRAKETGGRTGVIAETLARRGPVPLAEAELARLIGAPADVLAPDLRALEEAGEILALEGGYWVHRRGYAAFVEAARSALEAFYRQWPLRPGLPKEELRRKAVPQADARAFAAVLGRAVAAGELVLDRDRVLLPGREVRLTPAQESLARSLEAAVRAAGFSPPSVAELRDRFPDALTEELILHLQEEGRVVRLPGDLILHADHLREARERTRQFLRTHPTLTVADFRDLLGTTRKYALPILDHFDTQRWTRRTGDERVAGPLL
ncbi:selenocysteine-specific translation elongation factor [Caldinitratiruptor microaerophilus]|uniref:Selenocysteine-specific elongation factor n=1 Tax=Caldinitratiruptor microaerophilus TaxID=671077 RepID=A0AA35G8D1_9FIRM|nr:selenocysteine-specific translation elongation factor [Caldinitratiruptor microaerophilus]BDG59149.1 selenocysteine-specific translation elongation factor [Caldinitratiruptor microaerophilus]